MGLGKGEGFFSVAWAKADPELPQNVAVRIARRTSYKYMQRIEGRTPPDIRLSTIKKIADALKTTPANLLTI